MLRTKKCFFSLILLMLVLFITGQVHTYAAASAAITVSRVFTLDEDPADLQQILLVGVADQLSGAPDVLSVAWELQQTGWFPTWSVNVRSARGIIPSDLLGADGQTLNLGPIRPAQGHTYEVALSYDATLGYLSFALADLTDSIATSKGTWLLHACSTQELFAVDDRKDSLASAPWFAPVGTDWDVGTHFESAFLPTVFLEQTEDNYIRLKAAGPLPGAYRIVSATGKQVASIEGKHLVAGENLVAISSTDLPIGPSELNLQYIVSEQVRFAETRTIVTGKATANLNRVRLDQTTSTLVSSITLQSDTPLRDVACKLQVELATLTWDSELAGYVRAPHSKAVIDLGHVGEIPLAGVTMPFSVGVPNQPGIWQASYTLMVDPAIVVKAMLPSTQYTTKTWQVLGNESVKVSTDRADALYHVNETVVFEIQVTQAGVPLDGVGVQWQLLKDPNVLLEAGSSVVEDGMAYVTGTYDEPGFIQLRATYMAGGEEVIAKVGAGFDPLDIQPSLPVPDDFDTFWAEKKAQLAQVPMNPQLTPISTHSAAIVAYDVQVQAWEDVPVSGYLALPRNAQPGSLPAILTLHGAGVDSAILSRAVDWATEGMLAMDINAHGLPNGRPLSFYEELAASELWSARDYRARGRESRDEYYFLGMFLRVMRAIDYLTSRPEWDGRTVILYGGSQGGAQSFAGAGLDPRVTFFVASVPAMADLTGRVIGRATGWPGTVLTSTVPEAQERITHTARYFDAMNFATRTKAAAFVTVGFVDPTCPPTTVYAAYNNIKTQKFIYNDPYAGHSNSSEALRLMRQAVLDHATKAQQK